MRKRNHIIPLHLNKKELAHLEAQVKTSGLPREEFLRSPHHGRRTAGKALRPPRRSAPQGGRALQQRKPARQGSQHLWGGRSAEH